jgi:hypothetical protein
VVVGGEKTEEKGTMMTKMTMMRARLANRYTEGGFDWSVGGVREDMVTGGED